MTEVCSPYHNSLHGDPVATNLSSPWEGTSQVTPHSIDASAALLLSRKFLVKLLSQSSTSIWKKHYTLLQKSFIAFWFSLLKSQRLKMLWLHMNFYWGLVFLVRLGILNLECRYLEFGTFLLNFTKFKSYFVTTGCTL